MAARELRLTSLTRPLRTTDGEQATSALLAALAGTGPKDSTTLQLVVAPHPGGVGVLTPGRTQAQSASPWTHLWRLLGLVPQSPATPKELRDKTKEPLVAVAVRLGARSENPERARRLVRSMSAALRLISRPGVRLVPRLLPSGLVGRRLMLATTPLFEWPAVLNTAELAILITWPLGVRPVPGVERHPHRLLPTPPSVPHHGRVLGISPLPGQLRPIALSPSDSTRHLWCLAPTGAGKSTVLAQLIRQDLEAGRSLVLLDPKGELVETVLAHVPPERTADVVVLDLTDRKRPVPYNVLAMAGDAPERTVDEVVSLVAQLFAGSWGPRSSDVLRATLATLAASGGMTLAEAPALLTNAGFRRRLTTGLRDPLLVGFWTSYESYSESERAAVIAPVMNKLRAFLGDGRLRNVLGQAESTWGWDDVLDGRTILLVNLNRGEIGSGAAQLLGSLLLSQCWRQIQRRRTRGLVTLYLDELQDLLRLPTDLGDVLAQSRSAGVSVVAANQHLAQLDPTLRAGLLANARSKLVLQLPADDARVMAVQLGGELSASDLQNLGTFGGYLSPCVRGTVLGPVSLRTLPLGSPLSRPEAVRTASQGRYGRDRAEVEAAMAARQEAPGGPGRVGRRSHHQGESS